MFQQPWLYDDKSSMEKVLEALDELNEKLAACTERDKQIRAWQKIFKVIYVTTWYKKSLPASVCM